MINRALILLVSALTFSPAFGQTAGDVVANYIEKIGGADNLNKIKTIKMTGNASTQGMEFPVTILAKGKNKYKSFVSFQGMDIVQPAAYDGKEVWSTNVMTMQNELMDGDAAAAIIREAKDFPDALHTYASNGYTIELGTDTDVNVKTCYEITVIKPDLEVMGQELSGRTRFFIEKESGLAVKKIQSTQMGDLNTLLSDYREVEGVQFPFKLQTEINGTVVSSIEIKEIVVNAPMDDLQFAYPD